MQLKTPKVADVLMALHSIPERKRVAFVARIKHFQRLGFPAGTNTGRGRAAPCGPSQLIDLLIAFEMAEVGIEPERAVKILSTVRPLAVPIARDFLAHVEDDQKPNLIIQIDPRALDGLREPKDAGDPFDMIENAADFFAENYLTGPNRFRWRRLAMIDATQMMRHAANALDALCICSTADFIQALQELSDAATEATEKHMGKVFDHGHD